MGDREREREREIDIFYICDRKACANCHEECRHTGDISHAVNRNRLDVAMFQCSASDDRIGFFEVENELKENIEI